MSPQEVLASYSHIELTDEEMTEAIIDAKRKKDERLKELARKLRAEESRKQLMGKVWTYEQTRDFMLYRAAQLYDGKFIVDENNNDVFTLLCHYFSDSQEFIKMAASFGVSNPSLLKGILLCGNFGVGKSWMMGLFRRNSKRVFYIEEAKAIARLYKSGGDEAVGVFMKKQKNAFQDPSVLYQEYSGLCIEDIGAEDPKGNYGDKTLVVGDIIEQRYANGCMVGWFHGTTNLTAEQLKEYYTPRVTSRLRESINLIELRGPDRRK